MCGRSEIWARIIVKFICHSSIQIEIWEWLWPHALGPHYAQMYRNVLFVGVQLAFVADNNHFSWMWLFHRIRSIRSFLLSADVRDLSASSLLRLSLMCGQNWAQFRIVQIWRAKYCYIHSRFMCNFFHFIAIHFLCGPQCCVRRDAFGELLGWNGSVDILAGSHLYAIGERIGRTMWFDLPEWSRSQLRLVDLARWPLLPTHSRWPQLAYTSTTRTVTLVIIQPESGIRINDIN